jgi:multidrug efflux pump
MLIVALVVFLFMGSARTALVPLVAMPVSLIGAAIVMLALGFSLNLLTILAIVLSVGLVVDDAIVVVENVERHVRMGKTRVEAALAGARELIGPIIAMTDHAGGGLHTPIGFQGGLTGSLFLEFAITLAAAVVVSGRRADAVAGDELAVRAPARGGGPADRLVNRGFERCAGGTRGCSTARWRCAGRSSRPRCCHGAPGRCTRTRAGSSRRSRTRATSACSWRPRRTRRWTP